MDTETQLFEEATYSQADVDKMITAAVNERLAEYKGHVREVMQEAINDQGWCAEGANLYAEKLDVEGFPVKHLYWISLPFSGQARFSTWAFNAVDALEQWEQARAKHGDKVAQYCYMGAGKGEFTGPPVVELAKEEFDVLDDLTEPVAPDGEAEALAENANA
jgi:hypothetical protein